MLHYLWPGDDVVSHYQDVTPLAQRVMGCTLNMSHNLTTCHTCTGGGDFEVNQKPWMLLFVGFYQNWLLDKACLR